MSVILVRPTEKDIPKYVGALERGWSPDNIRGAASAREDLELIAHDPQKFLLSHDDREAKGGPVRLPDGSEVSRLPGYRRWIMDGTEFCGVIGLRWQPGTAELPPHVLGHIGYAVVPWMRNRGYATQGLAVILRDIREEGLLPYVELTTDPDNFASQLVIQSNGGELLGEFDKGAHYGNTKGLRWRIATPPFHEMKRHT